MTSITFYYSFISVVCMMATGLLPCASSFLVISPSTPKQHQTSSSSSSSLFALYSPGRSSSRGGNRHEKSKRQYRVGELVRTELAQILHTGIIRGRDVTYLEDELRQRISIVNVDVSPDLRQARVSVSIRNAPVSKEKNDESSSSSSATTNSAVDKRQAYSWLVENQKSIRHTLAQRMSHMKTSPSLTFVQVDVSAAVDVMYLIDKVSKGYERERIGEFGGDDDTVPLGYVLDGDEDEEDDEEWDEEDDDFFNSE